ncbi:MBL fold metallo-hydrolase [Thalassotalea sp. PP2-459]|uniref:MBL fold metallo-hydrolase n=1 Tax=Thalassotalea sp. PP2-459 TaxID=1742724 RepID=UPI0009432C94|nr:MBL fold metallo-hydrolase [Thalassotalea sp. PP2-459]OKY26410.1 MBL fold metallo-hydrolase [Thalassotalea sp. PP2-459]
MKKIIQFIAIVCWFSAADAHNHDRNKGFDIKVTDLGYGIFELRTDRSGNVAVLIGKDGVFMVDTQMEHLVELIDGAQKKLSDNRDVDLIINTHFHRDHVRGNAYFKKRGAIIMAHPNVRRYLENPRAIKALGRKAHSFTPQYYPKTDVTEGTSLNMNGQSIELHHTPNAHTNSDLFVVFKEGNVIHGGDLVFNRRFPFIDIDNGGSVAGYIAGIKKIIEVADEDTKIIAGHGPVATISDLEESITMLNDTHNIVKAFINKGLSLEAIKALNPLKNYTENWNWAFITTERMLTTHYYDITGQLE